MLTSFVLSSTFLPTRTFSHRYHKPARCRTNPTARIGERTLAVDYGLRRVGLAMSVGIAPEPLPPILHDSNPQTAASEVARVATRVLAATILVGFPLDMNGNEGSQAKLTLAFLDYLKTITPWATILLLDERLTTVEARGRLADRGVRGRAASNVLDGIAATLLLERYFTEGDDVRPRVVQTASASLETVVPPPPRPASGFAAWRAAAQARARASAEELRKTR